MVSTRDARYGEFLARLREARVRRGLTQAEAAALLRKPQSFVSRCESGERRVDVVELLDFAAAYDVPLGEFVPLERVAPDT